MALNRGTSRFRRALHLVLVTLPAAVFTLHLSGCTAFLPIVGAVADSQRKDRSPGSIVHVHRGASMTLYLRDGRSIKGWFDGREEMTPEAYLREWTAWRDTTPAPVLVPSPGDSVVLTRIDGTTQPGRLAAYGVDTVLLDTPGGPLSVAFPSIRSLANLEGWSIEQKTLMTVTRYARVPLSTLVRMTSRSGPSATPLHYLSRVEGPAPRGGKVVGLIVGIGADAAIVAAAVASTQSASCGGDFGGVYAGY